MKEKRGRSPTRLEVDLEGFTKTERLVTYEVLNVLFMLNLELQNHFKMRAEEYQVYLLIILATVQHFARQASVDDPFVDRTPLPDSYVGTISRRRIADVLGIPVETVRRIVSRFLKEGLIVERSRGRLATGHGMLAKLSRNNANEKVARRLVSAMNSLIRLGAVDTVTKD
jgi:hypothetical protein